MLVVNRPLTELDKLVLEFVDCISAFKYVIVSGYVAILFGRPRTTDDIDVIVGEADGLKVYQRCVECGYELLTSREAVAEEYAVASIRFFKPPRLLP